MDAATGIRPQPWSRCLVSAAVHGHVSEVQQLLESCNTGQNPTERQTCLRRALHAACRRGDAAIAQLLLDEGADGYRPALISAIEAGSLSVVNILLSLPSDQPSQFACYTSPLFTSAAYAELLLLRTTSDRTVGTRMKFAGELSFWLPLLVMKKLSRNFLKLESMSTVWILTGALLLSNFAL